MSFPFTIRHRVEKFSRALQNMSEKSMCVRLAVQDGELCDVVWCGTLRIQLRKLSACDRTV